jgi:hypothetical protein
MALSAMRKLIKGKEDLCGSMARNFGCRARVTFAFRGEIRSSGGSPPSRPARWAPSPDTAFAPPKYLHEDDLA